MTSRRVMVMSVLLALGPFVFVSAPSAQTKPGEAWPKTISIAGGSPGGGVHAVATGMASVVTKYVKVKTVAESGLFGKNLALLARGEVEFGMAQADLTYDAARGLGNYEQFGKNKLRLMFSGSTPPAAFVVRADSGIRTIQDLKGKKVMATMPANLTFTKAAMILLDAAGMNMQDINDITFSGPKVAQEALPEKRIDAFITFFPSMGKAAWAEQLNIAVPIRFITGDPKTFPAVVAKMPYAQETVIYAENYGKMVDNQDLPTIGIPHNFLCRTDLPDDLVYEVMKAFYDHLDELYAFHSEAKAYLAAPLKTAVLPYHGGASRYYKEKGMWTAELEAKQKRLLREMGVE
jgi:TRAP transporter TAXI family solute receptor